MACLQRQLSPAVLPQNPGRAVAMFTLVQAFVVTHHDNGLVDRSAVNLRQAQRHGDSMPAIAHSDDQSLLQAGWWRLRQLLPGESFQRVEFAMPDNIAFAERPGKAKTGVLRIGELRLTDEPLPGPGVAGHLSCVASRSVPRRRNNPVRPARQSRRCRRLPAWCESGCAASCGGAGYASSADPC